MRTSECCRDACVTSIWQGSPQRAQVQCGMCVTEGQSPARGATHAGGSLAGRQTEAEGQLVELETKPVPSSPPTRTTASNAEAYYAQHMLSALKVFTHTHRLIQEQECGTGIARARRRQHAAPPAHFAQTHGHCVSLRRLTQVQGVSCEHRSLSGRFFFCFILGMSFCPALDKQGPCPALTLDVKFVKTVDNIIIIQNEPRKNTKM